MIVCLLHQGILDAVSHPLVKEIYSREIRHHGRRCSGPRHFSAAPYARKQSEATRAGIPFDRAKTKELLHAQTNVTEARGRLGKSGEVATHRDPTAQRGVSSGTGDDAGHRIGNRFGASGGPENLSLQNWKANRYGTFKDLENRWATLQKQGYEIDVKVTNVTKAGQTRPYRRNVQWTRTAPDGSTTSEELEFLNATTERSRAATP